MEAALATLGVIALAILTFKALSMTWPQSSRLGGFRVGQSKDEQGVHPREDDDEGRWGW